MYDKDAYDTTEQTKKGRILRGNIEQERLNRNLVRKMNQADPKACISLPPASGYNPPTPEQQRQDEGEEPAHYEDDDFTAEDVENLRKASANLQDDELRRRAFASRYPCHVCTLANGHITLHSRRSLVGRQHKEHEYKGRIF